MKIKTPQFLELTSDILKKENRLRFRAEGSSMYPAIKDGDILNVEPLDQSAIMPGDVVLYKNSAAGLSAHRVIKKEIRDDKVVLSIRGDSSTGKAEEVFPDGVLGRVAVIERNGRRINAANRIGRAISKAYAALNPYLIRLKYSGAKPIGYAQGFKLYRRIAKKLMKGNIVYQWEDGEVMPRSLFAKERGRIIGSVSINDRFSDSSRCEDRWIFDTWVKWSYRGLGVGRRLMEMACERIAKDHAGGIALLVFEDNKRAIKFYQSIGFYPASIPEIEEELETEARETLRKRIVMRKESAPSVKQYYNNAVGNALILEETKKMIEAFNGCGIKTVILKGIFLSENIYKNIALRPMSDADILIKKEYLKKANDLLEASGYIAPRHYRDLLNNDLAYPINSVMYFAKDRYRPSMHIHWHLINSTWPLEALLDKIDMEKIWSAAQVATIDGVETLTLGPEDLIIYLAHHSFHHSFDRPAMAKDIVEVIRYYGDRIDWDEVKERSDEFGLAFIVYASLKYASRVSGVNMPQLEALKPLRLGSLEKMIDSSLDRKNCTYNLSYLGYLSMRKGVWSRAGFLCRTIFPSKLVMAHDLGLNVSEIKLRHYWKRILAKLR